jgi:hypothetical protein
MARPVLILSVQKDQYFKADFYVQVLGRGSPKMESKLSASLSFAGHHRHSLSMPRPRNIA